MKPIFGYGFFSVCSDGLFLQDIIFEYRDEDLEYYALLEDEDAKKEELKVLRDNMQKSLDEEKVVVNGSRISPRVLEVEVGFAGSKYRPYIRYLIGFTVPLRHGENVYRDIYEPTIAEYDYTVTWILPPRATVVRADVNVPYRVSNGNLIRLYVKKGTYLSGFEEIIFRLP
jgi:hypothetical protein